MKLKFKAHFKGVIIPDPGVYSNHIWIDDLKIPEDVPEDLYDYMEEAAVGYYILGGYDVMLALPWKDKNGEDIFTDDIVQFKFEDSVAESGFSTSNNLIGFVDGRFCYKWENKEKWEPLEPGDFKHLEVIGNRFQNPELMEAVLV